MKIRAHGLLRPVHIWPGDRFVLTIQGELVCDRDWPVEQTLTQWALVSLGGNLGYWVGGDSLLNDLQAAGATIELEPQYPIVGDARSIGVAVRPSL